MSLFLKLLELFIVFFKIGIFTFGGGHAMIPLISEEMEMHGWLDGNELSQLIAVSESTPGPFAINIATFIGSKDGILGSLFATLGVITPSVIIILFIASLFQTFASNKYVRKIIKGINPLIIGLILSTGLWFLISNIVFGYSQYEYSIQFDWVQICLFVGLYVINKLFKGKMHPVFLIIIAGLCGVVIYHFYSPLLFYLE